MRIFVVGNINAGKSYIVSKLVKKYPLYKVLSIDEFRKKYSDSTIEKELETRKIFADEIINSKDAIIEFSGGNTIASLFIDKLRVNSCVVLEVEENLDICLERINTKDFSKIPYPAFNESLSETIIRLDFEFKNNCIESNFNNKILYHYKINSSINIDDLPLDQYEMTIRLVDELENKYDCLFAFGSLGRGELNKYSDVDIFLKTKDSIAIVENKIKEIFPNSEIIIQRDQIAIYIQNYLLEINIITNLKEAQLFYVKSEIKNIDRTILLGDDKLKLELEKLLNDYIYNFKEELAFTISRLKYYVKSLPRIMGKKDLYKYYFHNNIIIHEYVKLIYFINGNRSYSYLPRYAYEMVDLNIWRKLIYTFEEDQEKHYNNIKKLTDDIISRAYNYLNSI
ncbi:MAG: nucleotidyltransferase domain-containing protein [Bacilli bacterium]